MDDATRFALRSHGGDPADMTRFVRATQADVWRLCAHLTDRECADDLTQETYLRAFRSLRSYRGDSPVRPWLLTIARRVVADEIASTQRRRVLLSQAEDRATHEPGAPDHADAVASQGLLKHLAQDRRVAFVLTQLLGYSYAEAAELCQCPVGTIRSRVARARGDLLSLLADYTRGTAAHAG